VLASLVKKALLFVVTGTNKSLLYVGKIGLKVLEGDTGLLEVLCGDVRHIEALGGVDNLVFSGSGVGREPSKADEFQIDVVITPSTKQNTRLE